MEGQTTTWTNSLRFLFFLGCRAQVFPRGRNPRPTCQSRGCKSPFPRRSPTSPQPPVLTRRMGLQETVGCVRKKGTGQQEKGGPPVPDQKGGSFQSTFEVSARKMGPSWSSQGKEASSLHVASSLGWGRPLDAKVRVQEPATGKTHVQERESLRKKRFQGEEGTLKTPKRCFDHGTYGCMPKMGTWTPQMATFLLASLSNSIKSPGSPVAAFPSNCHCL